MGTDEMVHVKKNRWFYGGLAIAILHPIPGGIIMGILLMREGIKKEGQTVLIFSIIWGLIVLLLAVKYGLLQV